MKIQRITMLVNLCPAIVQLMKEVDMEQVVVNQINNHQTPAISNLEGKVADIKLLKDWNQNIVDELI